MVLQYIADFTREIVISIITAIFIGIVIWVYNLLPVYLRPHKIISFLRRYKNLQISLSQLYYFKTKEKTINFNKIANNLKKDKFREFKQYTNYIDLIFQNSQLFFRIGEREENKDENCFFIKMRTPIRKRIFIGGAIKEIKSYLKKINDSTPFSKDEQHTIIAEVDLIPFKKSKIELKYKSYPNKNSELVINGNKVQVVSLESEDYEKILKRGLFKQMELMLK